MRVNVIFLCFLLVFPSLAQSSVQKFVLDDGMTVLISEMPSSPMAAINLWVKTGSANEGKFMGSGITHFVEHMLFKGTARRGAGVIPQEARAMGGYINASTGYDSTDYVLSVPRENFPKAVDLISDMVTSPVFDPVELEREREVIVKEMHMVNDNPDRKISDLVYLTAYHTHPYQYRIIGKEDIFRALKRDDLVEYHSTLYVPNNMILSVAGGIKTEDVLPLIKDKFKGFKARSFPLRNVPQEPEQIASRRLEMDYPTDLTRMVMAYQSVQLLDADLYALDVLSMALGQGESSRFYLELYKKYHLVESVSAGNYTPQDKGLFEISCLIKDQKVDHVIKAINNIIASIKSQGLMPDELDKVKRQVMAENIYDRQSAEGMADKAAADVAFTGSVDFSDRYLDGVRAVTNEDIKRVARRYLIEPRLNTVILKPISAKKDLPVNDKVSRQDVQKVVLPNGLILLLQEDHSLPIISISAVFNGGMRFETLPLNGLTSLMGSVWTKGLPGKTADQISRESESRAVSISSGGGRNSFTLSLNSLSEDREFILDYLEKFLKSPSFPETEIARDKEQMRTALIQRKDSVLQTSNRALVETLFEKHPLRWDSLGTEESLARIKRADILSAFDHCVRADNGVIAVFGDINIQDIRLELERRLASLPKGKPELPLTQESAPATMRLKELAMDKEQALVMFGFRGPMIKDADTYAAEVLVNVLSSSLGGRLFKRIRDEFGKSYTVSGSVSPAIDAGMMSFFALTTNEGIEKVRSIMQEEFTKVRETLISEQELADAKIYLKSKMARNMQSIGSQSITRAVDELLGLGYKNVDEYPAHIDAVSLEAVRAVAQKYLNTDHAAVVITRSSLKKTGE